MLSDRWFKMSRWLASLASGHGQGVAGGAPETIRRLHLPLNSTPLSTAPLNNASDPIQVELLTPPSWWHFSNKPPKSSPWTIRLCPHPSEANKRKRTHTSQVSTPRWSLCWGALRSDLIPFSDRCCHPHCGDQDARAQKGV